MICKLHEQMIKALLVLNNLKYAAYFQISRGKYDAVDFDIYTIWC